MKMDEPFEANDQIDSIRDIVAAINTIDEAIVSMGRTLDAIQPYAPGKISVRIFSLAGGRKPTPNFIVWKWTPTGRQLKQISHYTPVKRETVHHRVKSYGPFGGTEGDVRILIRDIKRLMDRRRTLTGVLGNLKIASTSAMRHANAAINELTDGLGVRMGEIHKRHRGRMEIWQQNKDAELADEQVRAARHAIPDPYDIVDAEPPPKPGPRFDPDQHVLPVDEKGDVVDDE